MMANYATAAGSSSIITVAIFYAMQSLITMQPGIVVDSRELHVVSFLRKQWPEDPPLVDIEPIPRPPVVNLPEIPSDSADNGAGDRINVPRTLPRAPAPGNRNIGFSLSDGPLINIVRVRPAYPMRATQMGLGGFVIVQFDVTENGQTTHAVIVESSHRVFEKAALNATDRLRYKPRVVDGLAIATTGIRYRFTFEMEK